MYFNFVFAWLLMKGDLSRDLYIIKRGHCNIVTADLKTKLEHLAPGDYFGECEVDLIL